MSKASYIILLLLITAGTACTRDTREIAPGGSDKGGDGIPSGVHIDSGHSATLTTEELALVHEKERQQSERQLQSVAAKKKLDSARVRRDGMKALRQLFPPTSTRPPRKEFY